VNRPIAIFDSGVGGLTVMKQVASLMPAEDVVYLGDTARVPYGIKGKQTIIRFARQNVDFLLAYQPKLIIVACNTASAVALPTLQAECTIPVLGVVSPGARAAAGLTRSRRIAVLGTEATVKSAAYVHAIHACDPDVQVLQQPCPLLVPIVEEGRPESSPVVSLVLAEYLKPVSDFKPDVVILGCTHYPLLAGEIARQLGPSVRVVDSAHATANAAADELRRTGMLRPQPSAKYRFLVTDNPERFERIGGHFWNGCVRNVELVESELFFETAGETP